MTTTFEAAPDTGPLPVSELGGQARAAPSPGRVIATLFAGLFFALGNLLCGADHRFAGRESCHAQSDLTQRCVALA